MASGSQAVKTDQDAGPSNALQELTRDDDALLKEFFNDLREVDRDNEVNRILWAFKLNPFEKLNLRFDATLDEVKKQYRKLSLMVHPDKCKHTKASDAFEILAQAQKDLMNDEFREQLMYALNLARDEVRKERKKETKHDNTIRLASLVHEGGREGVEATWEQTDEFHERWKHKSRDLIAKNAWRKKQLTKRLKSEEEKVQQEEKEEKEKMKAEREHHKEWEGTRENRVGGWRDFVNKSKSGKKAVTMLKPPKTKTHDEDRLYVQRPVGEQWAPPPQKKAKKK